MQSSVAQERRKQTLSLTQERLKELLKYFPRTGRFRWRVRGPRGEPVGREAGTRHGGYRSIGIDGVRHYEHRLAWLYVHGEHPTGDIDHDNGNPADNRISNLKHCPTRRTCGKRSGAMHPPWPARFGAGTNGSPESP